jgi:glycosyltransferase involved in cell wall biosynthesis
VFAGSPRIGAGEVQELVHEHGLEDRVLFLGHIDRADVSALLVGAAAMALPSEDEGFGIPAVEAMACGTPVVVSDRGSLPEVVGDAALVAPYGDDEALAGALRTLAQDGEVRTRMSEAGRKRAAEFSWRRTAEVTLSVYQQVCGARAA